MIMYKTAYESPECQKLDIWATGPLCNSPFEGGASSDEIGVDEDYPIF